MPQYTQANPQKSKRNRVHLLLAVAALALVSLACINAELTLTVLQQEGGAASLDVNYQQYLIPSYVQAAKEANAERAADFQAAGRDPGDPILPTTMADLEEAFEIQKYKDEGYSIQQTETGFTASRSYSLDQDRSTEEWKVRVIQDPAHPEQITYRVKVFIDLTDTDLEDLQQLRKEPLMQKPDPNATGGDYSGGSGFLGDLIGVASSIADAAEGQMAVEMYYAQKALKNSDPMEYKFTITLPGEILIHKLDGKTAGTLDGNTVTLVLSEADMNAYSGSKLVFHVESVLKDCSLACNEENQPHLIWDGDEDGVTCNCVCESGYEVLPGERVCFNCDELCPMRSENLVTDPAACEINKCGCRCGEGYAMNNAGSKCITEAEKEAEDNQRAENGGPSRNEIREVVTNLMLGMDVNQMPGWYLLTSGEREDLVNMIELMGVAVDRTNLVIDLGPEMSAEDRIRLMEEEQNRLQRVEELAIALAEEQILNRQRVQEEIIKEIGGLSWVGQQLLNLPGNIQKLFQTPRQLATAYVKGQMTGEVKKRIMEETHGGSPATLEAAAAELIKQLPYLATNGTVDDYYQYKELYQQECKNGCQGEEAELAHKAALDKLEAQLRDSYYGTGRADWAELGEAYDRAFWSLNKIGK